MQYYDQQECLFFKFNVTHTMIEILRPCHNIYWIYTKRISDMVMEIKICTIQFYYVLLYLECLIFHNILIN